MSCSKGDDDKTVNPSLVGKWEYDKIGTINSSGEEVLNSYVHACSITLENTALAGTVWKLLHWQILKTAGWTNRFICLEIRHEGCY